jgi:hypothetical protein
MRGMLAVFLTSVLIMMASAWAQDSPATPGPSEAGVALLGGTPVAQGHAPVPPPPTPAEIEMQKHAAKLRNQERFAKIKKDTDRLLELATQLKKSVDQASDQTLSLEVVRKAEQIEKLARQVRQKMIEE